jgi:hypothetical protein
VSNLNLRSFRLIDTETTVSLMTCDLGVVLEIAGGLSATALAFIVRISPRCRSIAADRVQFPAVAYVVQPCEITSRRVCSLWSDSLDVELRIDDQEGLDRRE